MHYPTLSFRSFTPCYKCFSSLEVSIDQFTENRLLDGFMWDRSRKCLHSPSIASSEMDNVHQQSTMCVWIDTNWSHCWTHHVVISHRVHWREVIRFIACDQFTPQTLFTPVFLVISPFFCDLFTETLFKRIIKCINRVYSRNFVCLQFYTHSNFANKS